MCSSKVGRHHTTCKECQSQRCHHCRHVVLITLIPEAWNYHFCPNFTCSLQKNGLQSFLLRTKPLCRPRCELLGKQTCSSKAQGHLTTWKEIQDQRCDHFGDVVLTTLMSPSSNCHFYPIFTCFLRKNGLWSFPLGRDPFCCPPGELPGKQTCSSKIEGHRTTFEQFQDQQRHHCTHVVLTTVIPKVDNIDL